MIEAFERGEVPEGFDHAGHVRLTWELVRRYGAAHGLARLERGLQVLTERIGEPGKYHATITWAYGLAIAERCADSPELGFEAFEARYPELFEPGLGLLRRWYGPEVLESDRARRVFVMPHASTAVTRSTHC